MKIILPKLIFIQNSVHLAGAQKSLSRLLESEELKAYEPCLISQEGGWLTDRCAHAGVDFLTLPFSSSRSVCGRLWKNVAFAERAASQLRARFPKQTKWIVHSNDHPDSLLGLALADQLHAPSIITLRTPGMSQRDFCKYKCESHRHVITVGKELHDKVSTWMVDRLNLVYNGVTDNEIMEGPRPRFHTLDTIVVLGSKSSRKGWQDLVEALLIVEANLPNFPLPEFHFLGDCGLPGEIEDRLPATFEFERIKVKFLGVAKNYRARLIGYPLAIHPSRSESFGMAALECVAAGVPLLAGETGMIPNFIPNKAFLHRPMDPSDLANKLIQLIQKSPESLHDEFNFPEALETIRSTFSTRATVDRLKKIYSKVAESC